MLNSKRDKSIKRYLSKVGKLKHSSKTYISRYYIITYSEELKLIVRFSDHFNDTALARGISIDIVKTSVGFYTLRLVQIGISYTLTEDVILQYLKSVLLLYPELNNTVTSYKKAADIASKISQKALDKAAVSEARLNKRDEYTDMVDSVYEENKALVKHIIEIRNKNANAENKVNQLMDVNKTLRQNLSEKNTECESLRGKLKKLKNVFNSI